MRKIKFFILILLVALISVALPTVVKAADITYETEIYDSINTAIYVTGLENDLEDGYGYYFHVTQDNNISTETLILNASYGKYSSLFYDSTIGKFYTKVSQYFGIFEKTGDYYIYLLKGKVSDKSTFEVIDGPTKLERPKSLPNGSRIQVNYGSSSTSFYVNQFGYNIKMFGTDRKIKFHVGKISDKNILRKISDKDIGAYDELYEYAQQSDNYIYSGEFDTTKTGVLDYNILDGNMTAIPGEYYFGYYELDDEDGKYVKLDDVRAYTADKNGILSGFAKYEEPEDNNQNSNITAPNISTVNSTIQNTKNTNDATAKTGNLPKTGKNVLIGITVLLFIVVGVFTYFKYSYLKDI